MNPSLIKLIKLLTDKRLNFQNFKLSQLLIFYFISSTFQTLIKLHDLPQRKTYFKFAIKRSDCRYLIPEAVVFCRNSCTVLVNRRYSGYRILGSLQHTASRWYYLNIMRSNCKSISLKTQPHLTHIALYPELSSLQTLNNQVTISKLSLSFVFHLLSCLAE